MRTYQDGSRASFPAAQMKANGKIEGYGLGMEITIQTKPGEAHPLWIGTGDPVPGGRNMSFGEVKQLRDMCEYAMRRSLGEDYGDWELVNKDTQPKYTPTQIIGKFTEPKIDYCPWWAHPGCEGHPIA